MPPNIFFLTGAPATAALNWQSPGLLDNFIPPVARFLGIPQSADGISFISAMPRHALWRSLSIDSRLYFTTTYPQIHEYLDEGKGGVALFAPRKSQSIQALEGRTQTSLSESFGSESIEEALSLFYEDSFSIHENVASSQLAAPLTGQHVADSGFRQQGTDDLVESSIAATTSLSSCSTASMDPQSRPPVPVVRDLSDLNDIPNAKYLRSIQPQTKTVNIIVGIITVSSPRAITTRRGGHVDLVELLVGDETKSGFGVNFWLGGSGRSNKIGKDDTLRNILSNLRPQDIVLLKNVALSSFRDVVYGQSLRWDMTKVHLLYRNRVDKKDTGGCYTADDLSPEYDSSTPISKVRRVKDWVLHFVGPGVIRKSGKGKFEVVKEALPPDTQ